MRAQRIGVVLLIAQAIAAAAAAQPSEPAPQPTAAPVPMTAPQAGAANDQQPQKPASAQELIARGEGVMRRGLVTSKNASTMLEAARKDADIIRITCLDDKLTQINANLRTAETRLDALKKAVDADRRMHEYTVLSVVGQKLQVLDQEARQCLGESTYETGETTVTTEIDTSMLPFEEHPSTPPVVLPPSLPTLPPPASRTR
jgi:hypothetical protein